MLAIDFYKRQNEDISLKIVELLLNHPKIDINITYEKVLLSIFWMISKS